MAKKFIELTLDAEKNMFKEAATYNGFNTSKNGCKEFNKAFPYNSQMVCIAKYDENQWIKIGCTVVNRNDTGSAHPWGKQASQEFQCFAQNEKICTNKILDFLNRNYKDLTKLPIKPMPTMSFQTNEQNKKKSKMQSNTNKAQNNNLEIFFDFEYWKNNSESEILQTLFDRVKNIYCVAKKQVPEVNPEAKVVGNIPIL